MTTEDTSENTKSRPYHVLQMIGEGDAEQWLYLGAIDARNAEHAYRIAGETGMVRGQGQVTLSAVSERHWQPTTAQVGTKTTVSIG